MSATLKLCENPGIYNDYENQIDFDSLEQQSNFWDSKVYPSLIFPNTQYTFVNTNTIKVLGNYNLMKIISYAFIDTHMGTTTNKRYYYFVTDIKLLSYGQDEVLHTDDVIQLELEEDVFQTYMFDYEIKESFIKREHQDRFSELRSDKRIYNTEPENLQIGSQYEIENKSKIGNPDDKVWYYVYCKEPICSQHNDVYANIEVPSPTLVVKSNYDNLLDTQQVNTGYYIYLFTDLMTLHWGNDNNYPMPPISLILQNDKIVKIVASRYLPKNLKYDSINSRYVIDNRSSPDYAGIDYLIGTISSLSPPGTYNMVYVKSFNQETCFGLDIDSSYSSITMNPNNDINIDYESKLFTFPYRYKRINNQGNYSELRNEYFNLKKGYQVKVGIINATNQIVIPVKNDLTTLSYFHKNIASNTGEVNLITDAWQQYQAQNSASINGGLAVKGIGAATSIIGGLATGNYLAAGVGAVGFGTQIANEMLKREDIKNTPDEIKQAPDDSYNSILTEYDILAYQENVKIYDEYLQKVWKYFVRFGYSSNNSKIPNLRSRFYYNYIQTLGCNIVGELNNKQLHHLQSIYDKGLTIWHFRNDMSGESPSYNFKFLEYDKENAEMSLKDYWS